MVWSFGGRTNWKGGAQKVTFQTLQSAWKKNTRKDEARVLGQYVGTITRRGTKYGFIEAQELKPDDVLVSWQELKSFKQGEKVTFTAFVTSDGKAQAKDLKKTMAGKDEGGRTIGRFVGTITRRGNKYGFIDSADLKPLGFDDALVNWDELESFKEGDTVSFTAFERSRGKAQAKDLKVVKDEAGGILGQYVGTITRRGMKYGFIEAEELKPDDVLVNWDELGSFKQGDRVTFTAFVTSDGKAQAKDLKPGRKVVKDEAGGVLGQYVGMVTRRGHKYGFVESADLKPVGFDDALVNWDELASFQEGDTVSFTAFVTSKGKCQAKDLKLAVQTMKRRKW